MPKNEAERQKALLKVQSCRMLLGKGGSGIIVLPKAWVRAYGCEINGDTWVKFEQKGDQFIISPLDRAEADRLMGLKPKATPAPIANTVEIVDPSIPTGVVPCDGILPDGEQRLGERICMYSEGGRTCSRTTYARVVCKFSHEDWYRMAGKPLPGTMEEIKPKGQTSEG